MQQAKEIVVKINYVTNKDMFMRYYQTHLAR